MGFRGFDPPILLNSESSQSVEGKLLSNGKGKVLLIRMPLSSPGYVYPLCKSYIYIDIIYVSMCAVYIQIYTYIIYIDISGQIIIIPQPEARAFAGESFTKPTILSDSCLRSL